MRHINFFSGGPKWGVLGGGPKVCVEKVYVLFPSLKNRSPKAASRERPFKSRPLGKRAAISAIAVHLVWVARHRKISGGCLTPPLLTPGQLKRPLDGLCREVWQGSTADWKSLQIPIISPHI